MKDLIKKTIFVGLGATVITAERLNAKLNELVDKGKLSSKEAGELTDKIMAEGRKEFEEGSEKFNALLDDFLRKANFARQKDFEALEARVAKLEALLANKAEAPKAE
jgi:polyhydroxyalkanoate synthesis regulator phasin